MGTAASIGRRDCNSLERAENWVGLKVRLQKKRKKKKLTRASCRTIRLLQTTFMPDLIFNKLDGDIQSKLEKKTKRKSKMLHEADEQDALVELLEDFGFTNVAFKWSNTPYNFDCDQVGGGVVCPCCNEYHDNNNYFYRTVDDMEIHVKNHSESCQEKVMNSYKVVKYLFERKVCRIKDTMDYVFEDEKPDENPSSGTPRTHKRVD